MCLTSLTACAVVFCGFVSIVVYCRMDYKIVGIKEENKGKISSVLSNMKLFCEEQQELLEELRSCISHMKKDHAVNKTTQSRNKVEAKLKDTETKVWLTTNISRECKWQLNEGMQSLKTANYDRIQDMAELITKTKDYQVTANALPI